MFGAQGIHLIRHAVYRTAALGGQFLLLGSGHADGDFRSMAAHEFSDSPDVRLMVRSALLSVLLRLNDPLICQLIVVQHSLGSTKGVAYFGSIGSNSLSLHLGMTTAPCGPHFQLCAWPG